MEPPSEAPQVQVEILMIVLDSPDDAVKAAQVVQKVEGVSKVDCSKDSCLVTAAPGKAKAVADALKAAGIQASVWVKVA